MIKRSLKQREQWEVYHRDKKEENGRRKLEEDTERDRESEGDEQVHGI